MNNHITKKEGLSKLAFKTVISEMPPLNHWPNRSTEEFDITKSEVCQWLMKQPEVMKFVFDRSCNTKLITFDSRTKLWYGVGRVEEVEEEPSDFSPLKPGPL